MVSFTVYHSRETQANTSAFLASPLERGERIEVRGLCTAMKEHPHPHPVPGRARRPHSRAVRSTFIPPTEPCETGNRPPLSLCSTESGPKIIDRQSTSIMPSAMAVLRGEAITALRTIPAHDKTRSTL